VILSEKSGSKDYLTNTFGILTFRNQSPGFFQNVFYKSLIAIGLILVLISPPLWVGSWYYAQRTSLRREVKSQLIKGVNPGDLVLFSFSKQEMENLVRWERHDEFEYEGNMYDVVRSEKKENRFYYWCWPDNQESILNKELRNRTAELFNNSPKPGEQSSKVILYFKSLFFKDIETWSFINFDNPEAHPNFIPNHYQNPYRFIPYSPPKSA
jgi:hypothetical protein